MLECRATRLTCIYINLGIVAQDYPCPVARSDSLDPKLVPLDWCWIDWCWIDCGVFLLSTIYIYIYEIKNREHTVA